MTADAASLAALITWSASHIVGVFASSLVLLLLGVAGVWQLLRRYGVHRAGSRFSQANYRAAYLGGAMALVASATGFFVALAHNLGTGQSLVLLDQQIAQTLGTTLSAPTFRLFSVLTHLGDPWVLMVLSAVVALSLCALRRYQLCAGWVLATGGNAMLNPLLKNIFQRVRPVHEVTLAGGWSFPSGHASGSLVVYGMLAYLLMRWLPARWSRVSLPLVLLAATLAFTVSCSRVLLQVHFASDVLGGLASGTAWLTLCITAMEVVQHRQTTSASRSGSGLDQAG